MSPRLRRVLYRRESPTASTHQIRTSLSAHSLSRESVVRATFSRSQASFPFTEPVLRKPYASHVKPSHFRVSVREPHSLSQFRVSHTRATCIEPFLCKPYASRKSKTRAEALASRATFSFSRLQYI